MEFIPHSEIDRHISTAFEGYVQEKFNHVVATSSSFHRYTSTSATIEIQVHQNTSVDLSVLPQSSPGEITDKHFPVWSDEALKFINNLSSRWA
jgi:hypothetical protein